MLVVYLLGVIIVNTFGKFTGAISNGIAWVMSELNIAPDTEDVTFRGRFFKEEA
jgi:hypothetical protein